MTQRRIHVVGAALVLGTRCLLGRRLPGGAHGGLWEFPGGKVEESETPKAALAREIQEELGISVTVGAWLAAAQTQSGNQTLHLDVHWVELRQVPERLESRAHQELRWFGPRELEGLMLPQKDSAAALAAPDWPAARRLLEVWSNHG